MAENKLSATIRSVNRGEAEVESAGGDPPALFTNAFGSAGDENDFVAQLGIRHDSES